MDLWLICISWDELTVPRRILRHIDYRGGLISCSETDFVATGVSMWIRAKTKLEAYDLAEQSLDKAFDSVGCKPPSKRHYWSKHEDDFGECPDNVIPFKRPSQ